MKYKIKIKMHTEEEIEADNIKEAKEEADEYVSELLGLEIAVDNVIIKRIKEKNESS